MDRRHRQAIEDRTVKVVLFCAALGLLLVVVAAPVLWVLAQLGEAMAQALD